jgi:DNA-binding GntR family transcriptional regulator
MKPVMETEPSGKGRAMTVAGEKQTVTQVVTDRLRQKILSGGLVAGAVLRQDAIAADYTVSRIPVREALRQLEAEGLVTFYAHKGAVVATLAPHEIEELFEVRALVEPSLLLAAAPHLGARALKQAERFVVASSKMTSPDRIGPGWDFYATLYAPAGKPKQLELVRGLHNQTNRYWVAIADDPDSRQGSYERRTAVIQALARGAPQAAADALRRHFEACAALTVAAMKRQPTGGLRAAG